MAFREDFLIYPTMVRLSGCLCAEITASELPEPCFCGIIPGTEQALDCGSCDDGCGAAWVRLSNGFITSDFPQPDISLANCNKGVAFALEVGITRCFSPFGDAEGNMPGVDEYLRQTRLQLADMAAIRRAISCCFATVDTDYILGSYSPIPFDGGCGGGAWEVYVMQES